MRYLSFAAVILAYVRLPPTPPQTCLPAERFVTAMRTGLRFARESTELKATLQKRPTGDNRGELQNNMGSQLSARRSGYPMILTHDSVVKPADCGGPLVDLDGNVIGINISRAGRTESWVIPTEVIRELLADLKSGKLAPVVETATAGTAEPMATSPRTSPSRNGVEPRREP